MTTMQSTTPPVKIQLPFANSGTKTTIPVASQVGVTPGRASYTDGFPPLTTTPLAAGGVPPYGSDFNGVLNAITAIQQWQSAGGLFVFDATFATAVGGYPKGAILIGANGSSLWRNTVEGNANNPDAGGAGWVNMLSGALLSIRVFTASGMYTPSTINGVTASRARVRLIGGGGGGGGVPATVAAQYAVAGGGAAGSYVEHFIDSGLSAQMITVGAGGTAGAGTGGTGGTGGTTAFGAILNGAGGNGGSSSGAISNTIPTAALGGQNGVGGGGGNIVNARGQSGTIGIALNSTIIFSGDGGCSPFGGGGNRVFSNTSGTNSTSPGGGGGGASAFANGGTGIGGTGSSGLCIIEEYV